VKLKTLIEDLKALKVALFNGIEIQGISSDSQSVKEGYLFVALRGSKLDGHNFIQEAILRGAAAVVCEEDFTDGRRVAKIIVKDTRKALAGLAAKFYGQPGKNIKLIGITGTNGKTTSSFLLQEMLRCAGRPAGLLSTISYNIGERTIPSVLTTPDPVTLHRCLAEMVKEKLEYAILEVSSHSLVQHRLDSLHFGTAIFTNISQDHFDYHRTMDEYLEAKSLLFKGLAQDSLAIVNRDSPAYEKIIRSTRARILTYGLNEAADVRAGNLKFSLEGSEFVLSCPQELLGEKAPVSQEAFKLSSGLIGRHNVSNMLAAVAAALSEGIDLEIINEALKNFAGVPGRLEQINCGQEFTVFVDYAHTPEALENILSTLKKLLIKGKLILVFGCGGDRDSGKRPLMGRVAAEMADYTIITSDNPRNEEPLKIIGDIKKGIGSGSKNYRIVLDRFEAIRQGLEIASKGDIVVIAGKGHETYQFLKDVTIPFDDRDVVRKILSTKGTKAQSGKGTKEK